MNALKQILIFTLKLYAVCCVNGQEISSKMQPILIDENHWQAANGTEVSKLLSKKQIIILAEADHGQGSSLEAQSMIIKHLIDSTDHISLYIESSWINCDKIMEVIRSDPKNGIQEAEKYMRSLGLRYWVKSGFWNYLAKKIIEGKVELNGFDIDGVSPIIVADLFNEATRLESVNTYIVETKNDFNDVKWFFDVFGTLSLSSVIVEKVYTPVSKFIKVIITAYREQGNEYRIAQWTSILNYSYWLYKRSLVLAGNKYSNQIENDKQLSLFTAVRDSLMADIFLNSYKKNSSTKTICTMSTFHAIRGALTIDGVQKCCMDATVKTMGERLYDRLGNKIYSVCFTTASGEYGVDYFGSNEYLSVKKPRKGSLERQLKKLSSPYCFIDLENSPLSGEKFYMNVIFNRYLKAKWAQNFSGVFFIKKMSPTLLY
jgi:erythromycin esterase-like protein